MELTEAKDKYEGRLIENKATGATFKAWKVVRLYFHAPEPIEALLCRPDGRLTMHHEPCRVSLSELEKNWST